MVELTPNTRNGCEAGGRSCSGALKMLYQSHRTEDRLMATQWKKLRIGFRWHQTQMEGVHFSLAGIGRGWWCLQLNNSLTFAADSIRSWNLHSVQLATPADNGTICAKCRLIFVLLISISILLAKRRHQTNCMHKFSMQNFAQSPPLDAGYAAQLCTFATPKQQGENIY